MSRLSCLLQINSGISSTMSRLSCLLQINSEISSTFFKERAKFLLCSGYSQHASSKEKVSSYKTFKRISHLTQPHVYYPCCHTRPWERKTHCLSHFDGPAGERKFSHSSRKCFTCSCAQCICHEWTFFSAHLSVLMKPVEANVNKYVCTAERKYSCVFMDTTHECNALYMYGEALTRAL